MYIYKCKYVYIYICIHINAPQQSGAHTCRGPEKKEVPTNLTGEYKYGLQLFLLCFQHFSWQTDQKHVVTEPWHGRNHVHSSNFLAESLGELPLPLFRVGPNHFLWVLDLFWRSLGDAWYESWQLEKTRSRYRSLTHTPFVYIFLSHTHTLPLSHTHAHTLSHSPSLSLSHTLSLPPLRGGGRDQVHSPTFLEERPLSLSLPPSLPLILSLSLPLSLPVCLSLSHTHSFPTLPSP